MSGKSMEIVKKSGKGVGRILVNSTVFGLLMQDSSFKLRGVEYFKSFILKVERWENHVKAVVPSKNQVVNFNFPFSFHSHHTTSLSDKNKWIIQLMFFLYFFAVNAWYRWRHKTFDRISCMTWQVGNSGRPRNASANRYLQISYDAVLLLGLVGWKKLCSYDEFLGRFSLDITPSFTFVCAGCEKKKKKRL